MPPFLLIICVLWLLLPQSVQSQSYPVLEEYDITVTTGAAAGYVPDAICADCHQDKAESFAEVGMAKSFYRPSSTKVIEDFDAVPFYHAPSNRYYEMELREHEYWFRRYQLNAAGDRIHQYETKVDWILGSGHHSRVYIVQHPNGEMYQLPLAWYSQQGGKWEMAPGFEFSDHPGLDRQVRKRCMACHNALPEVPVGSDRAGMPETFPMDLPQGIGCQRCHGPGAAHVDRVLSGDAELEDIRAAIVQPGKLDTERLYGVCYGCHMQPSVAVMPQLRQGRGVYSFRPGQDLNEYKIFLDIEDQVRSGSERFDINHHPYRLEQSACFIQSKGALGCLNCHDPHRKVPVAERAAHYREACLQCHETDATGLPAMVGQGTHPAVRVEDGCTGCHMPERRTQDVIHSTMTDHRISRNPGPLDQLIEPLAKIPAEVVGVALMDPGTDLSESEKLIAVTTGILEHTGYKADYASDALQRQLLRTGSASYEPWLTLARSHYQQGDFAAALMAAEQGLAIAPDIALLRLTRGAALLALGHTEEGVSDLRALVLAQPDFVSARHNLALALIAQGQIEEAQSELAKIIERQPAHWPAWHQIARIEAAQQNDARAIEAYLRALAIAPDKQEVQRGLDEALTRAGRTEEIPFYRAAE